MNVPQEQPPPSTSASSVRAALLRVLGTVLFVIGAIGLVLPVWPTTIFWILAALAFAHSWPSMRDRIFAWPRVGPVVRDFVEHGVLSRQGKQHAVLGMLLGLLIVALTQPSTTVLLLTVALIACGIGYVLTRRSHR